jgi:hypothetical protein
MLNSTAAQHVSHAGQTALTHPTVPAALIPVPFCIFLCVCVSLWACGIFILGLQNAHIDGGAARL